MLEVMKLTQEQKVQVFCAALTGVLQNTKEWIPGGPIPKKEDQPVERASAIAAEAIAKIQSSVWADPPQKPGISSL
jgi:hypothetical protein